MSQLFDYFKKDLSFYNSLKTCVCRVHPTIVHVTANSIGLIATSGSKAAIYISFVRQYRIFDHLPAKANTGKEKINLVQNQNIFDVQSIEKCCRKDKSQNNNKKKES